MSDDHYNEEDQVCECEHPYSHAEEPESESRFGDDTRYYPGGPIDMDSATNQVLTEALERFLRWLFNGSSSN